MARARSNNSGAGVVLAVLMVFGLRMCAGDGEGPDADPSSVSGSPTMPDLIGMTEQEAEGFFDEWALNGPGKDLDIYDWDGVDLSPLDRYSGQRWVVVATSPEPGATFQADEKPRFFALRGAELSWFESHRRMPQVPVGQPSGVVVGKGGRLAGVKELVEYRYAYRSVPRSQRRWDLYEAERGVRSDLRVEPRSERRRHNYEEAYGPSSDLIIVGSVPPAGSKLRVGQVPTVLVKERPVPPSSGGSTYVPDVDVYLGDDDDDFNIPGWACPTRFC